MSDGLKAATEEHGVDSERILAGEWSEGRGRGAVSRLLATGQPIDAIFCGSDRLRAASSIHGGTAASVYQTILQ